ncbi:unnamed protein product [Pneumocystis jirovecii]|uniref:Far11/STRP C-terminal domain-containing protein n=1 Tax=Pneumocystis jirovecii TaxID=42068 RepID=L0PFX0_PNEJI|nr:unnamed protein product [Pneumocystis jirovecii]
MGVARDGWHDDKEKLNILYPLMAFLSKNEQITNEKENNERDELPRDSLTLLELRKILSDACEKETIKCAFVYADTDTRENELEEWYDGCNVHIIQGKHGNDLIVLEWVNCKTKEKKEFITRCLKELDSKNIKERNYGETKDQQDQMYWIHENNKIMNECGALKILYDSYYIQAKGSDKIEMDKANLLKIELICKMTSLYFLIETFRSDLEFRKDVVNLFPPIIVWIIQEIANLRDDFNLWKSYFPIIQTIQILWKLILCVLGNTNDLLSAKQYARTLEGLPSELNKKEIIATPLDYHIFRQYIISKYPSYNPPPTLLDMDLEYTTLLPMNTKDTTKKAQEGICPLTTNYSATPLPSPCPSPKKRQFLFEKNQDLPFLLPLSDTPHLEVPTSIKEASELFKSKTHLDLSTLQLWRETNRFMKFERGWIKDNLDFVEPFSSDIAKDSLQDSRLHEIEIIYTSLVSYLEPFVSVIIGFLNFLIDEEENYIKKDRNEKENKSENFNIFSPEKILQMRKREIASKSISSTLLLLLKWFKLSHILKFEFLSQIILDSNYINTFNKLFSMYDPVDSISHISEISYFSYFNTCNMQSENLNKHLNEVYNSIENIESKNPKDKETNKNQISQLSWRNLFSLVNHLRILQKLMKKKTYRNLILIQKKTWIHLQKLTKITNDIVELYTLKLFKGQIPYYNKKWKQNNMKIITSIYLRCRPELQDDWVSPVEVDVNIEESLERALRLLISFYNFYHYSFPNQFSDIDTKNKTKIL